MLLGSRAAGWMGQAGRGWVRARRRPAGVLERLAAPVTLPAGLDRAHLLSAAREHFLRLQAAWDAGDVPTLAALTTPQMLDDLHSARAAADAPGGRTDVVTLQARLLGFDELAAGWLAAIEFSGTLRESTGPCAPVAFRELWLLLREHEAPIWRLARQQALF